MDISDASLFGGVVALAIAAVRIAEKTINRVRRNGNGKHHPYEVARSNAKLDTLITLQREAITAQKQTTSAVEKMCTMRAIDDERHRSVTHQLDRIERVVSDE